VLGLPQMRDQGIVEFADAVRQMPAVSVKTYPSDSITAYARGRSVDYYQYDGGAVLSLPNGSRINGDLSAYDRIELLRGADGLGNGFAPASGVLNLVRKRPLDRPQVVVETRVGSWDHIGGMLDLTAPLGWDGRIRGRAVVDGTDKEYFYDLGELQRAAYYGIVEVDLTPSTLLSLGGQLLSQRGVPYESGGLPLYNTGAVPDFSRSTSFLLPEDYERLDTRQLFVGLQQQLGSDWELKLSVERFFSERASVQSPLLGFVDEASGDGLLMMHLFRRYQDLAEMADLKLNGRFHWFGQEQRLSFNLSRTDFDRHWLYFPWDGLVPVNIYDYPQAAPVIDYELPTEGVPRRVKNYGGSVTFALRPWAPLTLTTAYRWSVRDSAETTLPNAEPGLKERKDGLSYLGLSWALGEEWTAVGSWADAYTSNEGILTPQLQTPPPSVGDNYELGLKYASVDGDLNAALMLYRTERSGYSMLDIDAFFTGCCYLPAPDMKDRLEGVELEIAGRVGGGWNLSAGYTYASVRYRGDGYQIADAAPSGATVDTRTPRHDFKFWTSWRPTHEIWSRLELGAGLRARSRSLREGPALPGQVYALRQHGYAVADARLAWRLQPRWTLSLNVNNLLDRTYYATEGDPNVSNHFYGEPRSYLIGLRGEL
jgi:outer membrane receptor for ferric coprogen and ferric-rhodotorulic acid